MEYKKCSKCKIELSSDNFYKNSKLKSNLSSQCKNCRKKYYNITENHRNYCKNNRNKINKNEKISRICKKYNISLEEYLIDPDKYDFKSIKNKFLLSKEEYVKDRGLYYKYGITLNEYREILKNQDSKCKICKILLEENINAHLDHCHINNEIRGILCRHCNQGLGHFRDDIENLKEAIIYLQNNKKS